MQVTSLINKIREYMSGFDPHQLIKACEFAKKAHIHQIRASGEPYYHHPFEVAMILAEMHLDQESIITALLHDTIEDTSVTLEDVEKHFGKNIAKLVDGVTKLAKIKFQPDNIREGENFRKLLLAMSEDIRVLIVKLADRLHNMRTIGHLSEHKAYRISLETMEIYAPLAERIGMQKMKNELQDLGFAKLHPDERKSIIAHLEYLRADGGSMVDKIETHISKTIEDLGIKANVSGREKTPYSIWHKMKQKNVSFAQLSDVIAFRIIVSDLLDCYQVLGIIHHAYHMIPGSFKDYISTPKDNNYSSLHTVVVGPNKRRIEIQIRTDEMQDVNEWGVATHWGYKQGLDIASFQVEGKQYRWVRELLNILENSTSEDFIEHTKLEMYEDQVFCFTPKGEIIALPKGATSIDFAYALHSDLGNTCMGSKINGHSVPLKTKLHNGDQVEIVTSKNQTPSITWEKFVITGKAKSEIKKFIRSQQHKEYISLGKEILFKFLSQEGRELSEEELREYLTIFHKKNLSALYSSIGEGIINKEDILRAMQGKNKSTLKKIRDKLSFFSFKKKSKHLDNSIAIKGIAAGVKIKFATCCHPIPGDQIVGIPSVNEEIIVHTSYCDEIDHLAEAPEELIEVSWNKDNKEGRYIGRLKMSISNAPNALATACLIISKNKCNITNIRMMEKTEDLCELFVDIEVMGVTQIKNITASLRSQDCIHYVERFRS